LIPSGPVLWAKLHGSRPELTIFAEDGSGVSVLKNTKSDFSETTMVYLNGLGQSWVPYFHVSGIHSQLGLLPVMLHPAPRDIAVIGLGSGDTAFSLGGREETTSITCIEIVKPQFETLRVLESRKKYGGLESLLNDKRFQFEFTDGRSFIGSHSKKYDVIEADALRPNSAFAGNLYSLEYFELLKSRLKPGGFAVTWAPTERVMRTFLRVFPYAYTHNSVLIGSPDPITYEPDTVRRRLEHPFTRAYYARAGINIQALMLQFLALKPEQVKVNPSAYSPHDINLDLHPRDEYSR
jgi:spermidine synthase